MLFEEKIQKTALEESLFTASFFRKRWENSKSFQNDEHIASLESWTPVYLEDINKISPLLFRRTSPILAVTIFPPPISKFHRSCHPNYVVTVLQNKGKARQGNTAQLVKQSQWVSRYSLLARNMGVSAKWKFEWQRERGRERNWPAWAPIADFTLHNFNISLFGAGNSLFHWRKIYLHFPKFTFLTSNSKSTSSSRLQKINSL